MDKIVYIESDEEVIGIVDRLRHTIENHIALVVPTGSVLLSSIINLRLLQDEAKDLGKKIAIVSSDPAGRAIAAQVGFVVYESVSGAKDDLESGTFPEAKAHHAHAPKHIQEEEEQEFHRTEHSSFHPKHNIQKDKKRDATFKDLFEHSGEEPEYPEEQSFSSKATQEFKGAYSSLSGIKIKPGKAKLYAGICGALVIAIVLVSLLFPHATIYLNVITAEQDLAIPFAIAADQKEIKTEGSYVLPASWQVQDKEFTSSFTATGKKNVGDHAKGIIVVYNRSGRQHTIPAGSPIVASSTGKTFSAKVGITVPGAFVSDFGELVPGKVSFDVEATEAGEASNLQPGRFTIPAISEISSLVYGVSEETFLGGNDRNATVVTEEDIKQAKDKITDEAQQKISDDLGIKGDTLFVKGLAKIETTAVDANHKVDDEAESFTVTLRAHFSYLTFNRPDFDTIFTQSAPLQLSDQKSVIGDGYREATWEVKGFDPEKKSAELIAKTKVLVGTKIKEDYMRSRLSSLSIKEARVELLKYPDVELDHISFFPPVLVQSIPVNENSIKLKIEYIKK
ncbi:MAG: hypothetical protein WC045_01205 [Patescibacteria group bacterium]